MHIAEKINLLLNESAFVDSMARNKGKLAAGLGAASLGAYGIHHYLTTGEKVGETVKPSASPAGISSIADSVKNAYNSTTSKVSEMVGGNSGEKPSVPKPSGSDKAVEMANNFADHFGKKPVPELPVPNQLPMTKA